MPRIIDELPFTDLATLAAPTAGEYPLRHDAGSRVQYRVDPDAGAESELAEARIAVVAVPRAGEMATLLVIETGDWSVACALTSGQLHRLTNAVAGRGTRTGVRPTSVDGELVYLTGSPERLIVEYLGQRVELPAGPKRALSKALRAYETNPPADG